MFGFEAEGSAAIVQDRLLSSRKQLQQQFVLVIRQAGNLAVART